VFLIDLKSRTPIYAQVVENFKRLIVSGALPPDERVPSVRELAKTLTVNPNTVQKAYRELEARGYFYTVLGQGNFISKPDTAHETETLLAQLRQLAAELRYRGVGMAEILGAAANVGMAEIPGAAANATKMEYEETNGGTVPQKEGAGND
jgi:GntR family transcriptional regulator